ncbi:hypothetical protein HMPREF1544_00576 [Mucor circinelloides 1006PhL]|uniref:NodB homology domain-containing protein n=1 Tax=Mucor circinelloides f. circinelloides (strain 1006PhL) TaxID=1220926 RepID=S2KAR6_MUCC1|nr:hypothetical protein HMPREF1544_00576 [Mucor circinelloides 1006PhL]
MSSMVQAQIDYDDVKTPKNAEWLKGIDMSSVPKLPIRAVGSGVCPDSTCDGDDNDECFESCGNSPAPEDIYGCPQDHHWALTFDDGPSNYTSELLDILDKEDVKATFCVMGAHVEQYPDVLKRAYESGHQIASHTFSHPHLMSLSNEEIIYEVKATEEAIEKVIGIKPHYIRPPFGEADARVKGLLKSMGYKVLLWNVDPTDYDVYMLRNVSSVIQGSFRMAAQGNDTGLNLHEDPGFISLQHDLYKQSVDQVPKVIQQLKAKGYKFVTAADCNNDDKPHTITNADAAVAPAPVSMNAASNVAGVPKLSMQLPAAPASSSSATGAKASSMIKEKKATAKSDSSMTKSTASGYILSFATLVVYVTMFL